MVLFVQFQIQKLTRDFQKKHKSEAVKLIQLFKPTTISSQKKNQPQPSSPSLSSSLELNYIENSSTHLCYMLYVIFPYNINTATIIINNSINFETCKCRMKEGEWSRECV